MTTHLDLQLMFEDAPAKDENDYFKLTTPVPLRTDVQIITGLSLRSGDRGFPQAAMNMVPGYFRR